MIKHNLTGSVIALASMLTFAACSHDYDLGNETDYSDALSNVASLSNTVSTQNTITLNVNWNNNTATIDRDTLGIYFQASRNAGTAINATISADASLVAAYNSTNGTSYVAVPDNAYSIAGTNLTIPAGARSSSPVTVKITNPSALALNTTYLLPITLSGVTGLDVPAKFKTVYVVITTSTGYASTVKPNGIKSVVYVEVNDNNPLNALSYTLKSTGAPLFDIVNIFAANINYDDVRGKPVIYFNSQVNAILSNRQKYIVPLQQKGMKVLLSLLGNHQGVGIQNFTSRVMINDFAQQVKKIVDDYKLDGVDLDDEYAQYGANNQPASNDSSLVLVIQRLREVMPDKIITLYYYSDGPSTGTMSRRTTWNGITAGTYLDYSWQGIYPAYSAPVVGGMTDRKKLGAAAVNVMSVSSNTMNSYGTRTKNDGYGVFLLYNLTKTDISKNVFSPMSLAMYGDSTVTNGQFYDRDY